MIIHDMNPEEIRDLLMVRDAVQRLGGDRHKDWKKAHAEAEKGWKLARCSKPDCFEQGIWRETNRVQFGWDSIVESSEGWCPVHGWYEDGGGREAVFLEVDKRAPGA
jgi:hypothetical protein